MKKSYLVSAFARIAAEKFPEQSRALNDVFTARLEALCRENADASREKKRHLESNILPGIAMYETLQTVMPKDEALRTFHSCMEEHAWLLKGIFLRLMRVPGLYRKVPGIFVTQTPKYFGTAAGFAAREIETGKHIWRIDMTKCPYHDTCVRYGCPELCPSFCDSDDITYDGLHPRLVWHRTKTLGRGDDCCDFCMKLVDRGPETGDRVEERKTKSNGA